jgi:hypothetical protein
MIAFGKWLANRIAGEKRWAEKTKRKKENNIKTARALARLGCENPYARTWMVMLP